MKWQEVSGSLWFVPSAMIFGAAALAVLMVELSSHVDREALREFPRIFGAGAESSRHVLSTIASAMMTVAAVTFSITILAVAQASSQYTPRILRNFMRDRPSQFTLGTLTGVFVYCLVVIRTIRGDDELRFIPALAVLTAFALAILGIGVLIFFIHHVAGSLQASSILARVREDTIAAVDRLFPEEMGAEAGPVAELPAGLGWRPVAARRTGYITAVDADGLLTFAAERDTIVRMERGIGQHVIAGTPLVSVADARAQPDDEEDGQTVNDFFEVASFRTVEQDAAFGLRQMVDVAVKSLSPGVNDTSTAIASIDAIGAVLVRLARRRIEHRVRERDGRPRVIARGPTFDSLVAIALDEARRNADGKVSVLGRLLTTLETVVGCTPDPDRRRLLLDHAARILAASDRTVPDPDDRKEVRAAYDRVTAAAARSAVVTASA